MSEYIPKGGMCAVCKHVYKKCNHLDFKSMPVIEKKLSVKVVKCTEFDRLSNDNT